MITSKSRKNIDIAEFREQGYLQEANRLFFHQVGLALEVTAEDDGSESLTAVWDYREDPEGIIFADGVIDPDKIKMVDAERDRHIAARIALIGSEVQSG